MIKIIAEIGCNHQGSMELAKKHIYAAKTFSNVDIVKFQKRCMTELYTIEEYSAPHPNPVNSFGDSYGKHRDALEFSIQQHVELAKYCNELGVEYSTSVWDLTSAKEVVEFISPKIIKIPSATNLRFDIYDYLLRASDCDIHISLGMTTKEEISQVVDYFLVKKGGENRVVLYHCTSGYPIKASEACLLEIKKLMKYRESLGFKDIGVSGHWNGIALDIAAISLGANFVERHFTLDRTMKGTDHAASLEPDGMRRLVRDIRAVEDAMAYKVVDLLDVEIPQREKLKR